jgi:hypothetical protein
MALVLLGDIFSKFGLLGRVLGLVGAAGQSSALACQGPW